MTRPYTPAWFASVVGIGLVGLVLAVNTGPAEADDFKFQRDKQLHFAGSVGMGALANVLTDDPWKAFAGCSAVGGVIELLPKVTGHGVASYQDFAYDVAGCALGSYVGFKVKGLILARHGHLAGSESDSQLIQSPGCPTSGERTDNVRNEPRFAASISMFGGCVYCAITATGTSHDFYRHVAARSFGAGPPLA